ncbi:MAG: NEW3 domain-containing protein [Aristaeellaceae bacterium]
MNAFHSWIRRISLALLALCLLLNVAAAEETESSSYLEISTEYPAITVKAGDSLSFDLSVENQTGASQEIALSVVSMPEGWSGTFSTSSREVSLVHVKNGSTNTAIDFNLDIPLDTEDGDYTVELKAQGQSFSDTMQLTLKVNAEEIGDSSFTVEYPSQEGTDDTTFTYSATLINNTLSDQNYSFSSNAPSGWTVTIKPSGESTSVSALDVPARSSQGVNITVKVPADVEAGDYDISCTATSANEKMTVDLTATITGSYGIELSTPSGRLSFDTYANKETDVSLTVTNTGNTALTNVNLTSSLPTGWTATFAEQTLDLIEPGATVQTTVTIKPSEDAMSGDYSGTIKVKNSDANDSAEFRITVKTETKWGFIGIAIIVVLAAGIVAIVRKYGRR